MKKILFIVHLLRATPRVEGLLRFLPEFQWQPVVLSGTSDRFKDLGLRTIETPSPDSLGVLRRMLKINPEKDPGQQVKSRLNVTSRKSPLNFLFTLGGAVINYPCPDKNWKPYGIEAGRKLLKEEKFDAIISSSAPLTSHMIAATLKKEFKIPWIADLRDLWSQNHNYTYGPLRRWLDRRLELKTLAGADSLVTVAEPWAQKLRALHHDKKVYTILHGYNANEVNIPPNPLTQKFTITYTGSFYVKYQHPDKLFMALKELMADGTIDRKNIEVRFYGIKEGWLEALIKKYNLDDIAKQYGTVSRAESVQKQKESQILLHLDWDDPKELGVYSGKLFEYLGARRPILSTGGSRGDVVEELFKETGAGISAVTLEEIKNALKTFYAEYKTNGKVAFRANEEKLKQYTQREMAYHFVEILNRVTASGGPN